MKYTVASEHRDYFLEKGFIPFADFTSSQQLTTMNSAIDKFLGTKINNNSDEIFMAAHDMWRDNPELQKVILQRNFGHIAHELTNQPLLCIGYDQLIVAPSCSPLLKQPLSLQEMSAIQGIVCGLIIALSNSPLENPNEAALLPHRAGYATFISPTAALPFHELVERQGQRFLLIVYTQQTMIYIPKQSDPHQNFLKRFDYQFGDKISLKTHPIVFKG